MGDRTGSASRRQAERSRAGTWVSASVAFLILALGWAVLGWYVADRQLFSPLPYWALGLAHAAVAAASWRKVSLLRRDRDVVEVAQDDAGAAAG